MSIVDELLTVLPPPRPISELPSDIEDVPCKYEPTKLCLRCKQCDSISGRSRIITHSYECIYHQKKTDASPPYILGVLPQAQIPIDPSMSEAILQKEYGIISRNSVKSILGTYGAGPCIILCMRNRKTTETILAHIDASTHSPLAPFLMFSPEDSDVFIIGGANITREHLVRLLLTLKERGYTVTFANVIDDKANKFAIHCLTGECWLDDDVDVESIPVTIDEPLRVGTLVARAIGYGPLIEVKIPNKAGGRRLRKTRKLKTRKHCRRRL